MKKLLGVVLAVLMSFTCLACGGPKNETAICTFEVTDMGVSYEIRLEAERDVIKTLTQFTTIQLFKFPEEQVKLLDETIKENKKKYEKYDGVEYSVEVKDDIYYETITIDMTDAETIDSLTDAGLLPIQAEANKTSLDDTVEVLKENDWKVEFKEFD